MIKAAITQFWAAIVLVGVGVFLRKRDRDSDSAATETTVGLWNVKHSPQHVVMLMGRRTVITRSYRDFWYPFLWLTVAAIAVAASLAVPIVKTQDIRIGSVAPVNAEMIYVPPVNSPNNPSNYPKLTQAYSLTVPSALRAAGASAAAGSIPPNTVFISNSKSQSAGQPLVQISYSYGILGSDFGLMMTPDLRLNITGSCITDYTWFQLTDDSNGVDVYLPYNNVVIGNYNVSNGDDGPAFPVIVQPTNPWDASGFNYSYGIIISSTERNSFTVGTDPWYSTYVPQHFIEGFPYKIQPGRPALSCWESPVWSFRGNKSDVFSLLDKTDSKLSPPLVSTFQEYLAQPMIYTMVNRLGRSALASSQSYYLAGFDANKSSIVEDMSRLINTSYIATLNILMDSTQISLVGRDGLTNAVALLADPNTIAPRADEFVVSSSKVYALSVRVLIIVPAVLFGVSLLLLVLAWLPEPWRSTQKLNAVKLHKLRVHQAREDKKRLSAARYVRFKDLLFVHQRPKMLF